MLSKTMVFHLLNLLPSCGVCMQPMNYLDNSVKGKVFWHFPLFLNHEFNLIIDKLLFDNYIFKGQFSPSLPMRFGITYTGYILFQKVVISTLPKHPNTTRKSKT